MLVVVAGNAAWTLASIGLLFSGAVSPNLTGEIVVVAQAIATGVFAELQYIGLRRSEGAVVAQYVIVIPGDAEHRTRNLEIPGLVLRTITE